MNTDKPNAPRYFRLLEKGETRQIGDVVPHTNRLEPTQEAGWPVNDSPILRPVTADLWIKYSEQKPTKEDFEPTGKIECWVKEFGAHLGDRGCMYHDDEDKFARYWRRITPPTPAKTKSVTLHRKYGRTPIVEITPNSDGTAKLDCGDIISAESVEQFIQAREEVMK